MSYRMTVKLQHNYYQTAPLTKRDTLNQRLLLGLGQAGQLLSIGEQLERVVVEYGLGGANQFNSHQTALETVEWAAGQFFVQAVEAEVARVVQVGIYSGVVGGFAAFGVTAKAHPLVTLLAAAAAAYGGYKLGQAFPQQFVILRATRHPYCGWQWIEVQPPQLGGSQAVG
jgi:hypothetical protein